MHGMNTISTTCYLIRITKPYLSISTLKMIYDSLFHSIISYGIIFWGNSSHSSVIFKMQKRVIRIIMGYGYRESCREYIFSLLLFIVNNRDYFVSNNEYVGNPDRIFPWNVLSVMFGKPIVPELGSQDFWGVSAFRDGVEMSHSARVPRSNTRARRKYPTSEPVSKFYVCYITGHISTNFLV
jgi:hypothetical protein